MKSTKQKPKSDEPDLDLNDIAIDKFEGLLDSLNKPSRLIYGAVLGSIITALLWIAVLLFPYIFSVLMGRLGDNNDNDEDLLLPNAGTLFVYALFFSAPFIVAYSLGKMFFS
jgi:hypothetical protein